MINEAHPAVGLAEDLKLGVAISNAELMAAFDVGNQGGMRRSLRRGHLVVVSDHTKSLYEDRWEGNVLHYTGMGPKGDQSLTSQNRTLAESGGTGIKVYLFEVFQRGRYIFHGEASLSGAPYQETQPDQDGEPRQVWMFPLRLPSANQPSATAEDIQRVAKLRERALRKLSLQQLRQLASNSPSSPPRRTSLAEQIIRNEAVAEYVKKAAQGRCDLCNNPAPFIGKDRQPYLECHHVQHLADGGDDTIQNAVALCPNCHRRMHVLGHPSDKQALRDRIAAREAAAILS